MPFKLKQSVHEDIFWRTRLNAAFRTACGCFTAGLVLQLGNMHVQWTTFPIFAYVMAVTVVGESTFGQALQDTAGVLVGTIQGLGMGMLVLQLLGPANLTLGVSILCISISSFIIVYPQSTLVISKRVALAHSAILYVTASIKKGDMETVYFPLKLAGTTMVGAICGLLAVLLPFPHLAMFQVQSQVRLSARIVSERLRILVDAFCVNNIVKGTSLNLQAKSLAKIGSKIDAEIIAKENGIGWELPGFSEGSENLKHVIKGLSILNKNLLGMDLALLADLGLPSEKMLHSMLKDCLIYLADWACLALKHASADKKMFSCYIQLIIDEGTEALSSFNEELSRAWLKLAAMATVDTGERMNVNLGDFMSTGQSVDDLESLDEGKLSFHSLNAAFFFLFNLKRFVEETEGILSRSAMQHQLSPDHLKASFWPMCDTIKVLVDKGTEGFTKCEPALCKTCKYCNKTSNLSQCQEKEQDSSTSKSTRPWHRMRHLDLSVNLNYEQLRTAFKMSLAMAIGAFLGSWFDRKKGYWADITLGLGFTGASKGGSFKVANLRAQGTVAGSIYGLLVVLATKDFPFLRLAALIPWVVLTSFLRQSKIYGYAGAVSAFTGAIVILARTNKDSTDEAFTVVRIVEAFLGMASFIIVELLILPSRAAPIVKGELKCALGKLKDFTGNALSAYSGSACQHCSKVSVSDLKDKEKSLRSLFSQLNKLIKAAAEEPQLWFSAFPTNVYTKLTDVITQMIDLLHFSLCSFEAILKTCDSAHVPVDVLEQSFASSIKIVEKKVMPTLEFLEAAIQVSIDGGVSNINAKKAAQKSIIGVQRLHAAGEKVNSEVTSRRSNDFQEEFEKSFYVVVDELVHHYCCSPAEPHLNNSFLLSLGSLAFSLEGLMQESSKLEKTIHELLQLESPWSLIDLWDSSNPPTMYKEPE